MASDELFCEDLRKLAAESFELAIRHCRSCNEMHVVWPYVRLTREGSDDASQIAAMLKEFAVVGRRSLLIAGAADTGLLALAANAARGARFAVLDRCQVPLELCRRQARAWSIPVETVHQDLASLDLPGKFQVVLAHGTLPYLASEHHVDVLVRLRRALCPSGRLVLLFYTARPDWEISSGSDRADWMLARLDRMAVPLPEGRSEFHARLCAFARHHERRIQAFSEPELVVGMLVEAGFAVDRLFEVGIKFSNVGKAPAMRHSQRKFIAVTRPQAGH
jgi:hypothetical protein